MLCVQALGFLLGGCSSEGSGDWSAVFVLARDSWEHRDGAVQLSDAASIPYATLGLRIDGSAEHLVVLATDSGGKRLWTSAAKVALTTRNGRIVATAGLGNDLTAYYSDTAFQSAWRSERRVTWTADYADLGLYSVRVDCEDVPAGNERVEILGQAIDTLRIDESCRSDQLDWSFTNTFWVSRNSDRVWRSIQYIHPNMGPLEIELLRPPVSEN